MKYLETYLRKIVDRGNPQLAESIRKTAEDVGEKHIRNFSFVDHEVGLLFGNVQSGKTGQVFGILCKAADLGFPVFLLLTTDNVVLQQQTLDRVRSDLDGFCICGENDSGIFIENCLRDPVIVVLKKNYRMLRLWANVFNTTGFMKGNPLFVIDDEADAASLNTLVNKDRQSSINKYLDSIKNGTSSSLYLQVTGTPQALLLQTVHSGWRPLFTHYFTPGNGYLGGDFFFPANGTEPTCITYTDNVANPERSVVIRHVLVSAHTFSCGDTVSNCLIHPSVKQSVHQEFAIRFKKELDWCKDHLNDEFINLLEAEYNAISPERHQKKPFSEVLHYAQDLIKGDSINIIIMNGKTDVDSAEYERGCNFIIGGNTLGRGITFPKLHTIFYTRTAKKPQADTMWQHSRMFGYDRDPGLMRVFIEERLYKLFSDINATNNSIIAQVENGIENIKIYYSDGLNPTRKNVLDNEHLNIISGGTNYYPLFPKNETIEEISQLLKNFDSTEPYYQVSLRLMKEILSHIQSEDDFSISAFTSILDSFLSEVPNSQGILIVRRNRDVAQGTGALLSPNDWELGKSFTDKTVLTMYQVTGRKGWSGQPLWVPNIKLPNNKVYYDIF